VWRIAFLEKSRNPAIQMNVDVFVMNADGSDAIRLTNDPSLDGNPVWSPDR
jgi:Tol biopolymer transport system component